MLGRGLEIYKQPETFGGFVGLLDQPFATGATAAYSLRRLKISATKAVRVREDSGNTETDIGFSGGTLDTTALLNHCGSANGFVTKWYDQSGNGNDATQSTASNQPKIVSSGSVVMENSKPTISFDGSADGLTKENPTGFSNNDVSLFCVQNAVESNNTTLALQRSSYASGDFMLRNDDRFMGRVNSTQNIKSLSFTQGSHQLVSVFFDFSAPSGEIYSNGSIEDNTFFDRNFSGTPSTDTLFIGERSNGANMDGNIQEIVIYSKDQSSNRTDIETEINNHYSIF